MYLQKKRKTKERMVNLKIVNKILKHKVLYKYNTVQQEKFAVKLYERVV